MCFSATASFVSGSALVLSSVPCLRLSAKLHNKYMPLALTPALFGIQQLSEGAVWHYLNSGNEFSAFLYSKIFLFFAFQFWLCWIPFTAFKLEESANKKRLLLLLSIFGAIFGASLYIPILLDSAIGGLTKPVIINHCMSYPLRPQFIKVPYNGIIYFTCGLMCLLLSSNKKFVIYWSLTIVGGAITYFTHNYAWFSVWCFFGAISSFIIWLLLKNALIDDGSEKNFSLEHK